MQAIRITPRYDCPVCGEELEDVTEDTDGERYDLQEGTCPDEECEFNLGESCNDQA